MDVLILQPADVIDEFGRLTGLPFRRGLLPCIVMQQAAAFAKHFELWELRLVVEWTRAQIRITEEGGRGGLTKLSLQWHCMFADGGDDSLATFQQRLGLAMDWARRSRPSLIPSAETPTEASQKPTQEPKGGNVDPSKVSELKRKLLGGSRP